MEEIAQKRQLAAIMFTDIVGYTALMGEDEEKALHTRRINREIHQQKIEAMGGTWLKEMGDGTLASFSTITEAVQAAIEIRKICKQELSVELKIGIHLGDIVHEDDDVFGDGVNIAARIEALAVGGGILISEPVFNAIKNKVNVEAAFVGEATLKNVDRPVKLYQVLDGDLSKPTIKIDKGGSRIKIMAIATVIIIALLAVGYLIVWPRVFPQPYIAKSIAVLPFKNLSEDNANKVFIAGVMSDINSLLARMKEIDLLINPQSVEKYRETDLTTAEIANELEVNYLITGNGRRAEDNVKLSVQLIMAATGEVIWSKEYSQKLLDIFQVQSDIAKQIAGTLKIQLTNTEKEDIEIIPTQNKAAYEAYLKGNEYSKNFYIREKKLDNELAVEFYKKSIALDSSFAQPYFDLAYRYWLKPRDLGQGYNWFDSMPPLIDRGLELQPRAVDAYHFRYLYYWWKAALDMTPENIGKAKAALLMIDEIMPNHPQKYGFLANFYDLIEQPDSTIYYAKKNVRRRPNCLNCLTQTGYFFEKVDQYEKAKLYYLEVLKRQPDYIGAIEGLCFALRLTGDYNEALERAFYLNKINVKRGSLNIAITYVFMRGFEQAEKSLIQAIELQEENNLRRQRLQMYYGFLLWRKGEKKKARKMFTKVTDHYKDHPEERLQQLYLSAIQSVFGNKELAIQYLQEAFAKGYVPYRQIVLDPMFDKIRDDPQVQKLIMDEKQKLKKMQKNLAMMEAADELKALREK